MKKSSLRYLLVLIPLSLSALTLTALVSRTKASTTFPGLYSSRVQINLTAVSPQYEQPTNVDDTKYLAYLPHSGFANQRTELVNAIILAKHLNRTLLIPPLFLGQVEGWQGEGRLWETLAELTDPERRTQCLLGNANEDDQMCAHYKRFGMLRWSWATDLAPLTTEFGVQYLERQDMSLQSLQASLDISPYDIYRITDEHPYAWDVRGGNSPLSNNPRYIKHFRMNQLEVPHKVLHFYGLFGEGRVAADKAEREQIKNVLVFQNPQVVDVAAKYVQAVGGVDQFTSIHIRTGDGVFRRTLASRIPMAIERLHRVIGDRDTGSNDDAKQNITDENRVDWCMNNQASNPRNAMIFVATDAKNPREDLAAVFNEFPCAVTMQDFPSSWLDPLQEASVATQQHIEGWLLTFVDAEIAQQAKKYIPSPGSTFSGYIGAIHRQRTNYTSN
ncbi:hypothetical protein NQZ79_g6024 [Umbelopsis isabellina]|nr:hypothetical protein NQZ79_g6024 [Umbelopsis isabellina]